jgi:hypothetical protein
VQLPAPPPSSPPFPSTIFVPVLRTVTARWQSLCPVLRFRILRWICTFAVVVFLLSGYALLTDYNLQRFAAGRTHWSPWTRWDSRVPVAVWTFWLYILYYPVVMAPVFLVKTRRQLAEVLGAFVVVSLTAWICYVFIPVRMEYPALECTGISCRLLLTLHELDGGVNVMPSLHAAHSALAATIFWSWRSRLAPVMTVAALAITVSAVLTGQHYLVDMPIGLALGVGGWFAVRGLAVARSAAPWSGRLDAEAA